MMGLATVYSAISVSRKEEVKPMYNIEDFVVSESVFSAILGSALTGFVAWFLVRRKRQRDARYLASRITHQLDEYVMRCVNVAIDYGPSEPDEGIVFDKSPPEPPVYPNDVDWTSIDRKLMHQVLALPSKTRYFNILVKEAFCLCNKMTKMPLRSGNCVCEMNGLDNLT